MTSNSSKTPEQEAFRELYSRITHSSINANVKDAILRDLNSHNRTELANLQTELNNLTEPDEETT